MSPPACPSCTPWRLAFYPPPPTSPPLKPTSKALRRTGLLLAPLALAALLVAAASLLDPGSPVAAQSDGSTEPSSCATEARQARSERTGLDFSYYPGFNTHTENDNPRGMWSDGVTLWVGDSADSKLYAYHLSDATGANAYGSRDSGKDIAGVTGEIQYITGDDNYIWTADRTGSLTGSFPNGGIYAYNRSDLSRAADKDFAYRTASTDTTVPVLAALATDGSHIWLAGGAPAARAFRLTDDPTTEANEYGTRAASRDITFSFTISGLHIDGNVIWAINSGGVRKAEARRLSDGARLAHLDVNFGNRGANRAGVWYNGVTIFLLDRGSDKVFTFREVDNGAGLALTRALTPGQPSLGLRADLSGIRDPDGRPDDVVYEYQWLRDCAVIMGATGASYQPTEGDAEAQLTLRLSYTDDFRQEEEIFADAPTEAADTVIAVPWHWELTPPTERAAGSEFRLMFLTDTGHAPDSTDIANYNAYVQGQVNLEGSPASLKPTGGFFRVLASTADVGARDNTATNFTADEPVEIPTYWLSRDGSGQTVADSYQGLVATTRAAADSPPSWNSEDAARLRTGELIGSPTAKLAVLTGSLNTGVGLSGETLGSDKVAVGHLNAGQTTAETPMGPAATGSGVAKTTTAHRYYALSPVFRVVEGRPGGTVVSDGPCHPEALLCATVERMPSSGSVGFLGSNKFTVEGEGYLMASVSMSFLPERSGHIPQGWRLRFTIKLQDSSQLATVGVVDPALFKDLILEVNGHQFDLGNPSRRDRDNCLSDDVSDCQIYQFYGLPMNFTPNNEQVPLQLYAPGVFDRTLLVSYDSPLNSGNLDGGELFRVMFVTYLDHTAPFCAPRPGAPVDERCGVDSRRTIEEYNAFVQQQARLGGWWLNPIGGARRSSGFRALVSTDTTDARDNTLTRFEYSDDGDDANDELGVPIYWLQGLKLAGNYQDFYDGSWSNPAAGRDGWGHPFDLTHFAVATGSRDDGTVDPAGFMGKSGGDVVRAGPGEGGLQGASLLDVGQGLRIYALSPIFEVRKAQPTFTAEVQTESWNRDPDTREAGDLTIHVNATHPAGRVNGAQIERWDIEGRSLSKIFERETFRQSSVIFSGSIAKSWTWENVTAGHWYALRVTASWDQGSWNSGWFYARAGTGRRYALDPESAQRTALARAALPQTKPGGVRGLSAAAVETGVVLSWQAPVEDGDGHPVFYRIERALAPGQWEELEPGTLETSWTDPSPPESGNVFYRVAAYNAAGSGPWLGAALQLAAADPNAPATGQPTISGTVQVGETLTADTTGISDDDGRDNVSFSYQWQADDADIADATNSTYTLADADEGKTIKVKVTFEDDAGNGETLTSAATAAVAAVVAAPSPLTARFEDQPSNHDGQDSFTFKLRFSEEVALSYVTLKDHAFTVTGGTVDKAQRLTQESNSGWTITATPDSDADVTLVLPETTDCDAAGAVCTDDGKQLSAALTLTVPGPEPPQQQNSPATGAPTISGTARVDQTLSASTSGISDTDGLVNVSYGYQWQADDSDIAGATAANYTLTDAEQGKAIRVRVSFEDDAGNEETLTSAATATVAARPNTPATGAPTIGGTVQVGETLTAATSNISDADGLINVSYSYQWQADDSDIAGATAATYTLADADLGKTVTVRVSFDDDAGNEENLTSTATIAVAAAPSPLTARFEDQPSSHDGQTAFTFELHFSEEFGVSYATLRDHAFSVTGGTVSKAQRLTQGTNLGWRITVTPGSDAEVSVLLPETTDCDDQGAVCTGDGRMLSNRNQFTVSGN